MSAEQMIPLPTMTLGSLALAFHRNYWAAKAEQDSKAAIPIAHAVWSAVFEVKVNITEWHIPSFE